MISLKDIAERTGLSINTVSRALRGSGYVSVCSRQLVESAAVEMGYQPNRAARSLRCRKSFEVAAINFLHGREGRCDSLSMSKVIGMKHYLAGAGYELSLHFAYDGDHLTEAVSALLAEIVLQKPAGIILNGGSSLSLEIYRKLEELQMPCVMISYFKMDNVNCVYIDRQQGVYDAVKFMLESGRQRVGFVGFTGCSNRISGYRKAVAEFGQAEIIIEVESYHHSNIGDIFEIGRRNAVDIARLPLRPDGIQAYSDYLAAGLIAGFHESGLRIPEDIAIIGFDDRELAMFTNPPLTTIEQPNEQTGKLAADLLLQSISGSAKNYIAVKVPMALKKRRSA
ncbi:MAG: LacI family DNA-binding transcriptional regulator [Victivallaceae bacterium]